VKQPKSGLGLFPLDDVTRVHAENYVKNSTFRKTTTCI
jgi:hypothetical protein